MTQARLSPSTLNLFCDCARCFWLEKVKNLKRPRGIFPSLPGGMDRVIKAHFDQARASGKLPSELKGKDFEGLKLYSNQAQLNLWREWRTGLVYKDEDNSVLSGALDELLVAADRYVPFDYKTKGSPTTEEDAVKYYQNQLDCYALMLDENGLPTAGYAFLLYFSPRMVGQVGQVEFNVQAIKILTDVERARNTFRKAVSCLKGERPNSAPTCEYCSYIKRFAVPK